MNLSKLKTGDRVTYIPTDADGNPLEQDVENGTVSSVGSKFAFVRFDRNVSKLGWDGATSQACDPANLVHYCAALAGNGGGL